MLNDKTLTLIAAIAADGAIGRRGDLLWHLPADLRHFKELTLGAPVIMGRKTWESLPKRPLPGRQNIVITSNSAYDAPGALIAPSLSAAVKTADSDKVFIIGGGSVYAEAISHADTLELTRIDSTVEDADTRFPEIDPAEWSETDESRLRPAMSHNDLTYRFVTLTRK